MNAQDGEHPKAASLDKRKLTLLAAVGAIVLGALAAYSNTFSAPFVFDDQPSIVANPSIKNLWPPTCPLSPPSGNGLTVSGRPLVNLSLALNYAASGTEVWSYHLFNLLVHAAAGLVLFGLARRTLERGLALPETLRKQALPTAAALALLWTLHPLQTEAVTYTVQRAESLMGLFYLLTLYCFVRATAPDGRSGLWSGAAVVSCLAGMACKEVMATAPLLVLLYDRTFVAGTFSRAVRDRRNLYVSLAATWLLLAYLVYSTGGDRGGTFNYAPAAFRDYWLTQFGALTRYLRLSFWPHPLVFEYGVSRPALAEAAPLFALCALLASASLWALFRKPALGFCGAAFFLLLAPTSVVPGVMQTIVEHRMYLPLAAVLAPAVCGLVLRAGRRGAAIAFALALIGGGLTWIRNRDYRSELVLWEDTIAKRPQSSAAQGNLGSVYERLGRLDEARQRYEESLRLNPSSPLVHYNLGLMLVRSGQFEQALAPLREAVRLQPKFETARCMLATALVKRGRLDEAQDEAEAALRLNPASPDAHHVLGLVRLGRGRLQEALSSFETALREQPEFSEAEMNLSLTLIKLGRYGEVEPHLRRALQLAPDPATVHFNLALGMAAAGRFEEAARNYRKTLELKPDHAEAHLNLGILLGQSGALPESLQQLRTAASLLPESPEAHLNLGIALALSGETADAISEYGTALRLRPDYAVAHYNLGNALLRQQRWAEAREHYALALKIAPGYEAARLMYERLRDAP